MGPCRLPAHTHTHTKIRCCAEQQQERDTDTKKHRTDRQGQTRSRNLQTQKPGSLVPDRRLLGARPNGRSSTWCVATPVFSVQQTKQGPAVSTFAASAKSVTTLPSQAGPSRWLRRCFLRSFDDRPPASQNRAQRSGRWEGSWRFCAFLFL